MPGYAFQELSDEARQVALSSYRYYEVDFVQWDDCTRAYIHAAAAEIGIVISELRYSGFCSQGDGASFIGSYVHKPNSVILVMAQYPEELELHRIALELHQEQVDHGFELEASTYGHRGNHVHEYSVDIEVYCDCKSCDEHDEAEGTGVDDHIADLLRGFMRWAYRKLEEEYNHLTSDEYLEELFEDQDLKFTEEGDML